MTIIDFHTHVDEAPAFGWIDPPDKIVALLDEAGIDLAVAMTYTDLPGLNPDALDYILDAVARFPDRLVAFVRLNPNYRAEAAAALEEANRARGARSEAAPHHDARPPRRRADRVACCDGAASWECPALFHCGDDPYTTPQTMAFAAAAAPDTAIVLGHMGGYLHVEEAIDAAVEHANLYLETSAMPYPEHIRTAIDRVGPERVLFGSDGPGCNPRLELDKVRVARPRPGRRSARPRRPTRRGCSGSTDDRRRPRRRGREPVPGRRHDARRTDRCGRRCRHRRARRRAGSTARLPPRSGERARSPMPPARSTCRSPASDGSIRSTAIERSPRRPAASTSSAAPGCSCTPARRRSPVRAGLAGRERRRQPWRPRGRRHRRLRAVRATAAVRVRARPSRRDHRDDVGRPAQHLRPRDDRRLAGAAARPQPARDDRRRVPPGLHRTARRATSIRAGCSPARSPPTSISATSAAACSTPASTHAARALVEGGNAQRLFALPD